MAVGLVIDADLFDSRYIAINLIWLPLLTIPALLLKSKLFNHVVLFLYFVIGFLEISHWVILKSPISLTSVLVMANTNIEEANDFLNLKATYRLLLLLPYCFIYYLSFLKKEIPSQTRYQPVIVGLVLLVSSTFIGENIYHNRLIRKGVPQVVKTGASFIEKIKMYEEVMKEVIPKEVEANAQEENQQEIFVLILGESCNRNHLSLYGYEKVTSPKLKKRSDIHVFDDVVSPYSNTLSSVLSILTLSNLDRKIEGKKNIDIIDVFHSAGFKTFWLSNQSPIGVWDNLVTVFANKSDERTFVNIASSSSAEATHTASYDEKLFRPLEKVLKDTAQKKFIVLHLMGSHSAYAKRYPTHYNKFKGVSNKQETIAQYDNSILYNDFIVDEIFELLKNNNKANPALLSSCIYLADHGENVYDESGNVGHDYAKTLPKANVEIPFLVWLSSSYINKRAVKEQTIKTNSTKPFVSDDLFHSIIDLNFIKTPYLNKKRSLFDTTFNYNRKRILEDKQDYDDK